MAANRDHLPVANTLLQLTKKASLVRGVVMGWVYKESNVGLERGVRGGELELVNDGNNLNI